jgi:cytochrome P450
MFREMELVIEATATKSIASWQSLERLKMPKGAHMMAEQAPVEGSLLDPILQSCPYDFYQALHERCPVYHMPETGFYVVSRYGDLRDVLSSPQDFSNQVDLRAGLQGDGERLHQEMLAERGWPWVPVLQSTDPPEHTRYRKLVNRVFTPKRVREMRPLIEASVNGLIDQFLEAEHCEFVEEFAFPLPGLVIGEQLGLHTDQLDTYRTWTDAILRAANEVLDELELRRSVEIELECQAHVAELIERCRREPQDNLFSALIHAHDGTDEPALSDNELQSLIRTLMIGAFHTTSGAIAAGMWLLIRYPDQLALLRSDPSLMKGFVEETLRFESPLQGLGRVAAADVVVADVIIPKGSVVIARYGAANRDEDQFPDANRFDITRENAATHLAFGLGPHYCVGSALARAELEISFSVLLERLDQLALVAPLEEPVHRPNLQQLVLRELPISFAARVPPAEA